jgi:hypothetical protein
MTTLKGHFDGKQIVLDEPVPPGLAPNTPVTVIVGQPSDQEETVLDKIAKLARPCGLPPDFAEQHEHYTKGTPKR